MMVSHVLAWIILICAGEALLFLFAWAFDEAPSLWIFYHVAGAVIAAVLWAIDTLNGGLS